MIDRVVADTEIRGDGLCCDSAVSIYDHCCGWREDAESRNNTLDRSRWGGRMIGSAPGRNAFAATCTCKRHHDERTA
jgi:hypothetical protein